MALPTQSSPLVALMLCSVVAFACGGDGTSDAGNTSGANGTSAANGTSGASSGSSGTAGASVNTGGSSGAGGAGGTGGTGTTGGAGGESGTSGSGGVAGTSGSSGSAGNSGAAGSSGESGAAGTSGNGGDGGTSGAGGTSAGSSGASGTSGSSGAGGAGAAGTGGTGFPELAVGTIVGATEDELVMIADGVVLANDTMKTPCFKNAVLSASWTETNGLTQEQIWEKLCSGTITVDVEMYLGSWYDNHVTHTIGYENEPGTVHMNRYYVDTAYMVADNIIHEGEGHSQGFTHYGVKETSVPYGLNGAFEACSPVQP